jgi:BlaI family transcriptional regulator, penicillinase repressor
MVKKESTISSAELKVLEILWKSSPQSSSQIIDALKDTENWHNQTVKTLLSRLVSKKIISYKQAGNRYLYIPLLEKQDYQKATSYSFIERVFGGKISHLVAYFSKQEMISKEEIKELKAIIEELELND